MLDKLPVPGRPTNLDYSRARAYCACSRCGWGGLDIFSLIYHYSFLSPSLWETARYRLKYCLKGPLSPKQPTNQPSSDTVHCLLLVFPRCKCMHSMKSLSLVITEKLDNFTPMYTLARTKGIAKELLYFVKAQRRADK